MVDTPKPPSASRPAPPPPSAPSELSPERDYERLNPGAGGPPGQQQERGVKENPRTTRDDGGAALPGSPTEEMSPHCAAYESVLIAYLQATVLHLSIVTVAQARQHECLVAEVEDLKEAVGLQQGSMH